MHLGSAAFQHHVLTRLAWAPLWTVHGFCQQTLLFHAWTLSTVKTPKWVPQLRDKYTTDNVRQLWFNKCACSTNVKLGTQFLIVWCEGPKYSQSQQSRLHACGSVIVLCDCVCAFAFPSMHSLEVLWCIRLPSEHTIWASSFLVVLIHPARIKDLTNQKVDVHGAPCCVNSLFVDWVESWRFVYSSACYKWVHRYKNPSSWRSCWYGMRRILHAGPGAAQPIAVAVGRRRSWRTLRCVGLLLLGSGLQRCARTRAHDYVPKPSKGTPPDDLHLYQTNALLGMSVFEVCNWFVLHSSHPHPE